MPKSFSSTVRRLLRSGMGCFSLKFEPVKCSKTDQNMFVSHSFPSVDHRLLNIFWVDLTKAGSKPCEGYPPKETVGSIRCGRRRCGWKGWKRLFLQKLIMFNSGG